MTPALALTSLDLLGTFVFGLSGAMLAVRRDLDVFGIAVLALAAALSGGLIRDMALGATPVAALASSHYLLAAGFAALCVYFGHRQIEKLSKPVMILDALGLGLFAVTGTRKALEHGLDPLPAIVLGVLSAVGGGAVRDLLVTEVPRVLREEVYALAALLGAGIVVLGDLLALDPVIAAMAGAAAAALIRILSVLRGWQAPKPGRRD
jgi:uncharacterized membrane protein YeiH